MVRIVGRGGRASVWWMLVFALIASPTAGLLVAESVTESVELVGLDEIRVTVVYDLVNSLDFIRNVDRRALEARFSAFPHTHSTLSIEGSKIMFVMGEAPRVGFIDFLARNGRVAIDLSLGYQPKLFDLLPGVLVKRRDLHITYPSLNTLHVEDVYDHPMETNFTIDGTAEELTGFTLEDPTIEAGEVVRVVATGEEGSRPRFCAAALTMRGSDEVVAGAIQPSCHGIAIPTSASLTDADYDLHVIGVLNGAMGYAKHEVHVSEPPLRIGVAVEKDAVYLGDAIVLRMTSEIALDGCRAILYDEFGVRKNALTFNACTELVMGTSTALTPGYYIVVVEGSSGSFISRATARVELLGREDTVPVATKTDKDTYVAGEEITLYTDAPGGVCHVQVFDSHNTNVADLESVGCRDAKLTLDPSLEAGTYTIETTAYRENKIVAKSTNGIEVSAWRPRPRTPQGEACEGGSMYVLDTPLPCIETGQTCVPSSTDIPLCLCFDRDTGAAVDVCEYGRFCSGTGCDEVRIESPFIIVESEGECLAKSGLQTLSCLEVGEICTELCVCLDGDGAPVSSCTVGEVCSPDGCEPFSVEFSLVDMTPINVRTETLASEGVTITWYGNLRYEGALLGEESIGKLTVNASLGGRYAREARIYRSGDPRSALAVNATFHEELGPDRYEVYLAIEYEGTLNVVRHPFEVWYPREEHLWVKIRNVDPPSLDHGDLEEGFPLRVIADVQSMEMRSVADLPKNAFHLSIGEVEAASTTPTYNPISAQWTIASTFKSDAPPSEETLYLEVDHLGRRGYGSEGLLVEESAQLDFTILRTTPGDLNEPLYHYLVVMGCNMDIYIQIKGSRDLIKEDFKVRIGRFDFTDRITHATGTSDGVRLHLTDVELCPGPPSPGDIIPLNVEIHTAEGRLSKTIDLPIASNPGNYVVRCE